MHAEPRICAAGIGLTEGPLWTYDRRLLVTSISRGLVYEVFLDGREARPVLDTKGGPSGLAQLGDGPIWIANFNRTDDRSSDTSAPRIQKWDGTTAAAETVVDEGVAPNDITVGADGRVWFSNPTGHPFDMSTAGGSVRLLDPSTREVGVVCDGLLFPNGLAFGPDPDELYVSETAARRIVRLVRNAGGWSAPSAFATLETGHPDGLAFDANGYLYVAATQADAVLVFAPDGVLVERIDLGPSFPTSCAFGGSDNATLVVTVARGGRVLAVERDTPGLTIAGNVGSAAGRAGGHDVRPSVD